MKHTTDMERPAHEHGCGGDVGAIRLAHRVHDHAIADINRGVGAIGENIARLGLGKAGHFDADRRLGSGSARQRNAELGEDILDETGTIPIGISAELGGVFRNRTAVLAGRYLRQSGALSGTGGGGLRSGFLLGGGLALLGGGLGVLFGLRLGLRHIETFDAAPVGIVFDFGGCGFIE